MKRLHILILSLIVSLHAFGQVYPVRTITTVSPPYPTSLEQYANVENGQISLTIIPNDIALQNYPVRLRLVIDGGYFKIYSNPSYVHKSIVLNNGESLSLSGPELAGWFNTDNLIFEGYTKNQYLKTGSLPEGMYQIWFEVYDFYRDVNISGSGKEIKATIWSFENEPPILNFPANEKEVPATDPQNIVLNWTQRQSPYSLAGAANQYKIEIWEIIPDDMNVDEAVRTTRPIYSGEAQSTTFNYTSDNPILFAGKKYAWRVQVYDPTGKSRYKNDGYSEVRWFRFGKDCSAPTPALDKTYFTAVGLKWENDIRFDKYELRWKNKDIENSSWYTKEATGQNVTIDKLEQNTSYYIQMRGFCSTQEGAFSPSLTIHTKQDATFACGSTPATPDSANSIPLTALAVGENFKASDFTIEVYKVSGGNGSFSGKGYALVPLLHSVKFEVEFSGITINSNRRMTAGEVKFIYNINNGVAISLNSLINTIIGDKTETNPYEDIIENKTTVNAPITSISVSPSGDVTITAKNGDIQTVRADAVAGDLVYIAGSSEDAEQTVVDSQTKTVYTATPEKSAKGSGSGGLGTAAIKQPESKDPVKYAVTFFPHRLTNLGIGGMDFPGSTAPTGNYNEANIGGAQTSIPWKSVESDKVDRLVAAIDGPADSIHFITKNENMVMTASGDKSNIVSEGLELQNLKSSGVLEKQNAASYQQLLITGTDNDELKAWYPEYEKGTDTTSTQNRILAGQVNIVPYDKISIEVCLVEVNGAVAPEPAFVQSELNKIYASAIVDWKVTRISNVKVNLENYADGIFDNVHPDMAYSDHEKQVRDYFESTKDYKNNVCYLFFIPGSTKKDIGGFMPYNRQYGFMYTQHLDAGNTIRTMAHELGHGKFSLGHPFENAEDSRMQTYDDLMAYSQSSRLYKLQWDNIRKFHLGVNWFKEGSEGESVIINSYLPTDLANPNGTFTCITPGGNYITLPNKAYGVIFNHGILSWDKKNIVTGTLLGFSYNDIDYVYHYSGDDFDYYISNTNNLWLDASNSNPDGYIIGLPSINSYNLYKIKGCTLNAHKPGIKETIKNERTFTLDLNGICKKSDTKTVKYSYKSNNELLANNQYQITDYETEMLQSHENGREQLAISKIAQIRSMYPTVFSNFCTFYDRWNTPAAIDTKEWDVKVFTNQNALKDLWTTDKKEFYLQMLESFIDYCDQNNLTKNNILTNITESTDRSEVLKALESCSLDELIKMSVAQKLIIISKLLEGTCFWNIGNGLGDNSEKLLNLIIQQTSDEKVDSLLTGLSNNSKFDSKESIISKIICRTNDSKIIYGSDNYKELLKIFTVLCKKSILYTTQAITAKFDPDKKIDYTYSSFWLSQLDPIGTKSYNTTLNENGKIELTVKTITGHSTISAEHTYSTVALYDTEPTISLNPFEPIIFLNNCDLGMLSEFKDPEGFVAPAIFLKYVSDKASNVTAVDITMAVLDLSSITTGFGELSIGLTGWRKAWAMADMINGGINLTANVEGVANNETAREILQIYNTFTGVTALGRLTTSGVKGIYNVIQSTKSEAVILRTFDLNRLFVTINKAGLNLREIPDNDLLNLEKYLQKILDDATARGLTNVTKEAEEALGNIKGAIVAGGANILEDVALITSSNASKQTKIDIIAGWLKLMGKKNSEINSIIDRKIDLSSSVSIIILKKGEKVFRFERTTGVIESEKHFFTTADAADAGIKSVGFADPYGYKLVTYEIINDTQILKTKMNTNFTQYISDKLQNNIKVVLTETAY